jgi:hypothetical protein
MFLSNNELAVTRLISEYEKRFKAVAI